MPKESKNKFERTRPVGRGSRQALARRAAPSRAAGQLWKTPSGIEGLDDVTGGGLPRGRPTLVCGGAGCGKSLFAMEFLVRGALEYGENGVFVSFEEPIPDLVANVASLGFDLPKLEKQKKIFLDHVRIERSEVEEAGEYDLEGLFIRLQHAIDTVKAKRIVLDTIESLFSGLSNQAILRSELRRLFHWLKDREITAVITGERGEGSLTRHGLEEYVSDCVILLDHRVQEQVATRRLRIVKYRGSLHGTNEYPFLIDDSGISVLPLSSIGLDHTASKERIPTGIPGLDEMLGSRGFFRGSSVLLTGTAGTGKSTAAAAFVEAACKRGERALFFAFEESQDQILRNMASVGIELTRWVEKGTLRILTTRPTYFGLEMHLAYMHKALKDFEPTVVAVDPISNLVSTGTTQETKNMLLRLVDFLKGRNITAMFTSLVHTNATQSEESELGVSSLMDTWLLLRDIEVGGERNRGINVVKSRGMAHSNQVREFTITEKGIELRDAYLGETGILTGSARLAEEERTLLAAFDRSEESKRREVDYALKRRQLEAQLELIRGQIAAEEEAMRRSVVSDGERMGRAKSASDAMARSRNDRGRVGKVPESQPKKRARAGGRR